MPIGNDCFCILWEIRIGSMGNTVVRLKLEGIDGIVPQGVDIAT